MSYTRLSEDERYQIQHLHGGGFSAREIGAWLERAATTISRELRRNQGGADQYHARAAQRQSAKRRHAASAQARILPEQWAAVEARLMAEQWSPVQIANVNTCSPSASAVLASISSFSHAGSIGTSHARACC